MERVIDRSHQVDEFVVDDADDLFGGPHRLEHALAEGLLGDRFDEAVHDFVIDVGFQQRLADLLHSFANVGLSQLAAEERKGTTKTIGNALKHASLTPAGAKEEADCRSASEVKQPAPF